MNNTISEQRDAIRREVRSSRRALSFDQQQQASNQLLEKLMIHPRVLKAQNISLTLAYDGEIDLFPFIEWCWRQKKQIYLPVVHPFETGKLLFLAYNQDTEMVVNRYGIKEPKLTNDPHHSEVFLDCCPVNKLDLVFTPLVAFDREGNRIGMGGGYYDRLLSPWFKHQTGPYPIGLAHDCQLWKILPIQDWDVPLPEIITPTQFFCF